MLLRNLKGDTFLPTTPRIVSLNKTKKLTIVNDFVLTSECHSQLEQLEEQKTIKTQYYTSTIPGVFPQKAPYMISRQHLLTPQSLDLVWTGQCQAQTNSTKKNLRETIAVWWWHYPTYACMHSMCLSFISKALLLYPEHSIKTTPKMAPRNPCRGS